MKLSISNIAWSVEEDAAIFALLRERNVSCLEIAPTRIWDKPDEVGESEARRWSAGMLSRGLKVSSFQALLFGQPGLVLFGSDQARKDCAGYLKKIIRLASWVGAGPLVFGSPKNRLRASLSEKDAFALAVPFFRELGDYAAGLKTCLVIEPNPEAYGCDFVRNMEEAGRLVQEVGSPGFGFHVDAGELRMNGENLAELWNGKNPAPRHVHLSEPMLGPLTVPGEIHPALLSGLKKTGYDGFVAIEMKRQEPAVDCVGQALQMVQDLLRDA